MTTTNSPGQFAGHTTQVELTRGIEDLLTGAALVKAKRWLLAQYRPGPPTGWAYCAGTGGDVAVWGGTLDGLRGLHAAGIEPCDPRLRNGLNWMIGQQTLAGGFVTPEVTYASAQATAWVAIVLRELGVLFSSEGEGEPDPLTLCLRRACAFLDTCVIQVNDVAPVDGDLALIGGVATSPDDRTASKPSIYAAALTLRALSGDSPNAAKVAKFLVDQQDKDGGWPMFPSSRSDTTQSGRLNPASSAHALNALLVTGHAKPDDPAIVMGARYLMSEQLGDGHWSQEIEEWTKINYSKGSLRHRHFTTAWAVNALIAADHRVLDRPLRDACRWLITTQQEDGSWYADSAAVDKHIWCVSNAANALRAAREALIRELGEYTDLGRVAPTPSVKRFPLTPREIALVGILAALLAIAYRQTFVNGAQAFGAVVAQNIGALALGVISSLAAVSLAGLAARLFRSIRKRGRGGTA